MENANREKSGKKKFLLVFKILWLVTYVAVTAFLLVWVIRLHKVNDGALNSALAMIIFGVLFFGIGILGYIAATVFGLIGFVTSMIGSRSLSDKIVFAVATLLPIVTGIVWIVVWTHI